MVFFTTALEAVREYKKKNTYYKDENMIKKTIGYKIYRK